MRNTRRASITCSTLIACSLSFGALASAPSAEAQNSSVIGMVKVPFTFQVETQKMPAGTYQIERVSNSMLLLRGPDQLAHFMFAHAEQTPNAPAKSSIVFHRYGDTYFIGQVWTAGQTDGLECYKSRAEKDILLKSNRSVASLTQLILK